MYYMMIWAGAAKRASLLHGNTLARFTWFSIHDLMYPAMKWVISIALTLFTIFTLTFLLAEQAGWTNERWVSEQILALRESPLGVWAAAVIIVLLLVTDLFLPVPSSILMTLSGAILGVYVGWMVSLIGAMGCAVLGFGLCRLWGKPAFGRVVGSVDSARITRFFEQHGVWAIILSRSVPMLTEIISCLAGLSAMRFRLFFWVSLAGTWPLCIVYAWAGNRALDESAVGWAVLLAFILPAIGLGIYKTWTGLMRRLPAPSDSV